MGKRFLKFVSIQMICVMLFSMTALADVNVSGEGTSSGTTPSNFSVDEDVIGSGAIVQLPASLPLTYNEQTDSFMVESSVGVYGHTKDYSEVTVSTPSVILYNLNGGIGANYRSMSIPAPEVTNEEYPYTYAIKWNTYNGNGTTVTKHYITFESKLPVFLAYENPTDGFGNGAGYYMYVYKDGEYNRIRGFQTSSTGSLGYASRGCPNNPAVYYNCEETIAPYGTVHYTGRSNKVYNLNGTLNSENDTNQISWPWNVTPSTDATYQTFSSSELGADNNIYFSGMIFDSTIAGLTWMAAHAGDSPDVLENDNTVIGHLKYGKEKDGVCSHSWTAADMELGANDLSAMSRETLTVSVVNNDIENIGEYEAVVEFTIKSSCIGMNNDVCPPNVLGNGDNLVQSPGTKTFFIDGRNTINYTALNLKNIPGDDYMFVSMSKWTTTPTDSVKNLKYIQLSTKDDVIYSYSLNKASPTLTTNWLDYLEGLLVVVVPHEVKSAQFHTTISRPGLNVNDFVEDLTNEVYDNTDIQVGNALSFKKGIAEDGKFIYVPHICYRGTMAEWKALSNTDDWVFGNAKNVVTVHCTDGVLTY